MWKSCVSLKISYGNPGHISEVQDKTMKKSFKYFLRAIDSKRMLTFSRIIIIKHFWLINHLCASLLNILLSNANEFSRTLVKFVILERRVQSTHWSLGCVDIGAMKRNRIVVFFFCFLIENRSHFKFVFKFLSFSWRFT